jgi:RNA polymerase sigma factor (sigma-70 family)
MARRSGPGQTGRSRISTAPCRRCSCACTRLAHSDRAEGWLFAATVHGALNALRSGGRRLRRERTEGMRFAADRAVRERDEDPAVAAERAERRRLLRRAMARLPRAKAAILALRYGGLSYAEVARALGVRTGSVGTLLRRAEAALRKEFDDAARP